MPDAPKKTAGAPPQEHAPLANIREAAAYLNIAPSTLYKLLERNKVPAFKVGGAWRFDRAALAAFLASRARRADPGVLIVEADPAERARIAAVAARRASAVATAGDFPAALALAAASRPDVVLLGVGTGGGDIVPFVNALRDEHKDVRVVFIVDPKDARSVLEPFKVSSQVWMLSRPAESADVIALLNLLSQ